MFNLEDKLVLRKFDFNDADELFILKNDKESARLLGGFSNGYTKKDINNWIKYHIEKEDEFLLVINEIESDKLIGHVGLYNIDHRIKKAEFGILIADAKCRGKGYGSMCLKFMLDYGFNNLNLNRIELSFLKENISAEKLYLKYSFEHEGILRQAQYKDNRFYDVVLMAKLKNSSSK